MFLIRQIGLVTLLLGALSSCNDERPTSLIVAIDSDIAYGPSHVLRSIGLTVRADGPIGPVLARRVYILGNSDDGFTPLPTSALLDALSPASSAVWIELQGCSSDGCSTFGGAGSPLVVARVLTRVTAGSLLRVPMYLSRVCAGVSCNDPLQRCDPARGVCASAIADPSVLTDSGVNTEVERSDLDRPSVELSDHPPVQDELTGDDAPPFDAVSVVDSGALDSIAVSDATLPVDAAPSDAPLNTDAASADVAPLRGMITAFAVGARHACALAVDGSVWCWGDSADGQTSLGVGMIGETPRQVAGVTSVVSLTAGGAHSCAVTADGRVYCWGSQSRAQTGRGTPPDDNMPSAAANLVDGLGPCSSVAAGLRHTCALLRDGRVACWGDNTSGQSGVADAAVVLRPEIIPELSGVISLALGDRHSCALLAGGTVRCWGDNALGQLGRDAGDAGASAHGAAVGVWTATALTAGRAHTCARLADGSARCWGDNSAGQCGLGVAGAVVPEPAPVILRGVAGISAGAEHTCAWTGDGVSLCWGANTSAQVGSGSIGGPVLEPSAVRFMLPVAEVRAGSVHTCARTTLGTLWCWGGNLYGQIGDGTVAFRIVSPAPVPLYQGAARLALGNSISCAVTTDGGVRCSGTQLNTPMDGAESLRGVVEVATGWGHACARLTSGSVSCWGNNQYGQVGNGSADIAVRTPVTISGIPSAVRIAAGFHHTCVLDADGQVWCWGQNVAGQLGGGAVSPVRRDPGRVVGVSGATDISLGTEHSCVVAGGRVVCWGANASGQIGRGDRMGPVLEPIEAGLPSNTATTVAAGAYHTCALIGSGNLWCWGANGNGQVVPATTTLTSSPSPTQISFPSGGISVACGSDHTCVVSLAGVLRCWGANTYGQIGIGSRGAPVRVLSEVSGATDPIEVFAKDTHTCARLRTGAISCWGRNEYRAMGLPLERLAPTRVIGLP